MSLWHQSTPSSRHLWTFCPKVRAGPCRPCCPKVCISLKNAVCALACWCQHFSHLTLVQGNATSLCQADAGLFLASQQLTVGGKVVKRCPWEVTTPVILYCNADLPAIFFWNFTISSWDMATLTCLFLGTLDYKFQILGFETINMHHLMLLFW